MRRLLTNILSGVLAMSASAGVVTIKFNGTRPDTIVYNTISYAERVSGVTTLDWRRVPLTADSVVINVDDSELIYFTAWPLDLEQYNMTALVGPGEQVDAVVNEGNMRGAQLSGTEFLKDLDNYRKALDEFEKSEVYLSQDRDDRIMAYYHFLRNYARSHRGEDIGLWLLQHVPVDMMAADLDSISERVREGMLQPLYEAMRNKVTDYQLSLQRKKRNSEHGAAPDFALTDMEGNEVKLSDLRGEWVLLDFWATWCKWCIKGFPELKKFAEEYEGRCRVIGLSTDDHKEIWKEYMKSHPSNHIEVWVDATDKSDRNPKRSYAIEALPTKLLIAPDGTIALYEVGENPGFIDKVKALIDK